MECLNGVPLKFINFIHQIKFFINMVRHLDVDIFICFELSRSLIVTIQCSSRIGRHLEVS